MFMILVQTDFKTLKGAIFRALAGTEEFISKVRGLKF